MIVLELPSLSERLRDELRSTDVAVNAAVESTFKKLRSVTGYENLDGLTQRDVRSFLEFCAALWFDTILSGHPLSDEPFATFREVGRRRLSQGIPLEAVLTGFRIGCGQLWQVHLAIGHRDAVLRDELLFVVSPALLEFFDILSKQMTQAYLEEQFKLIRWQDALRYRLCANIFDPAEDEDAFCSTANALGIDPHAPRIAMALDIERHDDSLFAAQEDIEACCVAAATVFDLAQDRLLSSWRRDRLFLWLPCEYGRLVSTSDRTMAIPASALGKMMPKIRAVGLGLSGQGARGWARSAEEARRALDFGCIHGRDGIVRLFSDIAVEESIRASDSVALYVTSLLEQLSGEVDLVQTLDVYFRNRMHKKTTAGELGIHVNTLAYRLDRIQSILDLSLEDVSVLARLDVALKLRRGRR